MINWKIILVGVLGVIAGILGNMYANKLSEGRIIAAIKAEIEALKVQRLDAQGLQRLNDLNVQLKLLTA